MLLWNLYIFYFILSYVTMTQPIKIAEDVKQKTIEDARVIGRAKLEGAHW